MDTIIVVDEFLQKGLVLLEHLITHVWDVVKERLILHLRNKNSCQYRYATSSCSMSHHHLWCFWGPIAKSNKYADWLVTHSSHSSCLWTFHSPTKVYKQIGNISTCNNKVTALPTTQCGLFHTMKLCCRGDQEYMKGIPATVDRGLMAMAWALNAGKPNSTVHICKRTRGVLGLTRQFYNYIIKYTCSSTPNGENKSSKHNKGDPDSMWEEKDAVMPSLAPSGPESTFRLQYDPFLARSFVLWYFSNTWQPGGNQSRTLRLVKRTQHDGHEAFSHNTFTQ